MTTDERRAFLAAPRVAVLCVERTGRAPLAVPVWYDFEDGLVTVLSGGERVKTRAARAAERFALCVQCDEIPYSYVTVEGPLVEAVDVSGTDARLRLVERYVGSERARRYVDATPEPPGGVIALRMRPESWLSSGYG